MNSTTRLITLTLSSFFFLLGSAFGQKASLEADVKGIDGKASRSAEIRLERLDKKVAPVGVKANWRGHATLSDVEKGTYKVTAIVEGGVHSSQTVKITANRNLLAFDLSKSAAAARKANRRFVWQEAATGTHLGGHWVEVGAEASNGKAGAQNVETMNGESMDNMQRMGRGFHPPAPGGE